MSGSCLNLINLIQLKGRDRTINVPQEVGAHYQQFGILLLNDDTGHRVQNIAHKCQEKPEDINLEIMRQWLQGKGSSVTWETLVKTLEAIGLRTLATDVQNITRTYNPVGEERLAFGPEKMDSLEPPMKYVTHLQSVYRQFPIFSDHRNFVMRGRVKEYITLTIAIKSDQKTRHEVYHETQQAAEGNFEGRTLINLRDIFVETKCEGSSVDMILVSGAPGIGKSTFAWEICRQWSKKEMDSLKHFTLVIFINLGDKRVQNAENMTQLLGNGNDSDLAAQYVKSVDGKNILFILDAFDELPLKSQENSLPVELIRGNCLSEATKLVTSRPSALKELQKVRGPQKWKHIEVLGFLQENIEKYGERAFDGETQEDFKRFTQLNPMVKGLMTYPLNALIITELYRDGVSESNPFTNTTELYHLLTHCLIRRKLEESPNQPDNIPYDKKYEQELKCLGKVAFDKLQERDPTLFFSELPESCNNLMGLLNEVESPVTVTYNFLHKKLQEYLAAFYITHLPEQEQRHLFLSEGEDKNLGGVWAFVAGITQMKYLGWSGFKKRYSDQAGVTNVDPYFAQCLYEAHDGTIVRKEFGNSKVEYGHTKKILPFDAYAIGWCISVSSNICDVDLGWNACGPEMVEMLVCGLKLKQAEICHLEKLDLSWNHLGDEGMFHFKAMPNYVLNNISTLNIADCEINSKGLDALAERIPFMAHLSELNIAGNHGSKRNLLRQLQEHDTIRDLNAVNTGISVDDANELYSLIQNSQSLEQLVIGEENSDISSACLEMLLITASLPTVLKKLTICIPQDVSPLGHLASISYNFEQLESKRERKNQRVVYILVLSSNNTGHKRIWHPADVPMMTKFKMV